jgi:TolB-like protein
MKRTCLISALTLMSILFSALMTNGFAQGKTDEVLTRDAERKEVALADRKNKIAVMPFQFLSNDPGYEQGQMSKRMQANCASSLRKNTSNILIQDPMTTNRLLAKNKIDVNDAAAVDPQELAVLLGVEYLVFGAVDVVNKGASSTGTNVTTYKDKEKQDKDKNTKNTKASGTAITSNNATTTTNYATKVSLDIYTDQGSTYYTKSRSSFGSQIDSYVSTLDYLIKRTPFGSKNR